MKRSSLRARSLDSTSSTDLSIQIEDKADSAGNPITVGTYSGQSTTDYTGGVETVTAQLDPISGGGRQFARLKIDLAE